MDILLVNIEIAALCLLLIGLHATWPKLGLAPLYIAIGTTLTFMSIPGPLKVMVPVLAAPDARYASLTHLTILLAGVTLVYALEGTKEARRLVVAILLAKVLLLILKLLLAHHLGDTDVSLYGREGWVETFGHSLLGGSVSTLAIAVDGLVILVVYQAVFNVLPGFGIMFALTVALVSATVADGLVFGTLYGHLDFSHFVGELLGRFTAGLAASVPCGLYIAWRYRRYPEYFVEGVVHRGAFDIMDLREELSRARAQVEEKQAEVDHVKGVFGRYVAPDVVEDILTDVSKLELGGEVKDVTILFTDIRGYSTLSERMSPTEIIGLLNEFFGVMSKVIDEFEGTIIEFEGDAILAVFGAPQDRADHADMALKTALAMLDGVEQLNRHWDDNGTSRFWRSVGLPSFRIRIGIHSGNVVVGNVGSETRTKYAVIGDPVNTAARVEGLNKKVQTVLLCTGGTVDALVDFRPELVDMGTHDVKGRAEPVQVFTVEGLPVGPEILVPVEPEAEIGGEPPES